MTFVELTKGQSATGEKSEDSKQTAAARVMSLVPKNKKIETEMAQGVILLAKGSTVSLPAMERFRMLRAKIERMNLGQKQRRLIAVTSAVPQEGKSVVASNLARALALDTSGRTLLIDCDLRRPTVHQFFGISRENGIGDVLSGGATVSSVIRNVSPNLDVITAGAAIPDPIQAIERPELVEIFEVLKGHYRYIIVDCPPVLVCPEPITLSTITDGTIIVARAWRTAKRLVKDAVDVIGKSNIMGMVVNDGIDASKQYLDYGYYGYVKKEPQTRSKNKSE